ncbi:hypothetical protein [Providencia sp. PROV129]|uniref:hypothetical protein n=1 Tax=Providencia sp. PROV129 TaxID=2949839 RepID=UPI00234A6A66|nr:hypothetical protein [Providencia sp. PROV129]
MYETPIQLTIRKELEPLLETINNLEFQVNLQHRLIIALMSELPDGALKGFTPFDMAIRDYIKHFPVNSDQHYDVITTINQSIELAENYKNTSPVE